MIIINFAFLGKDVKLTIEGDHAMNADLQNDPKLIKIKLMNNRLFKKEDKELAEIWSWTKTNSSCKNKKGRHTFYAL